jgi:hypothetical protein
LHLPASLPAPHALLPVANSSSRRADHAIANIAPAEPFHGWQTTTIGSNPAWSASQSARGGSSSLCSEKGPAKGPFFRQTTTGERARHSWTRQFARFSPGHDGRVVVWDARRLDDDGCTRGTTFSGNQTTTSSSNPAWSAVFQRHSLAKVSRSGMCPFSTRE